MASQLKYLHDFFLEKSNLQIKIQCYLKQFVYSWNKKYYSFKFKENSNKKRACDLWHENCKKKPISNWNFFCFFKYEKYAMPSTWQPGLIVYFRWTIPNYNALFFNKKELEEGQARCLQSRPVNLTWKYLMYYSTQKYDRGCPELLIVWNSIPSQNGATFCFCDYSNWSSQLPNTCKCEVLKEQPV